MCWNKIVKMFSKPSNKFPGVVVGELVSVNPHPNADRLKLTEVNIGTEILNIVCGASNIVPGQRVPVALVGTTLPNGMAIQPAVIRGQASEGMLCAEDELGLGSDHSGIRILNTNAVVGENIDRYL